ncbi:uncharacterized protein LOC129741053 [Uranotaenia lowii]|uniref:uncharacterized protein LOC129741053 n=1 Tax=Uranotaenia lowii TaxID=190385 RepID=UPI00247ADA4E|nr:uncharacterized protein LOC129741053 [Uranotaenia lowii]
MSKSTLKALLKRERQLYVIFDGTDRFIQTYQIDSDRCQLSSRLHVIDTVYSEFFEIRSKIELLLDEADEKEQKDADSEVKGEIAKQREEENDKVLQQFDDRYFAIRGDLLRLQGDKDALGVNTTSNSPSQSASGNTSRVKLPEIRLPSFSGKIREWITFRDSFRSLIHDNEHLTSMDKFTYLRSSLQGDALKEINNIELSEANYDVAWKTLQVRYENKKLIVKAHLDALFALEPLKKENYDGLNFLISEFEKNLMMLQKIGEPTESWSTILVYMLCSRLDSATLRQWETHYGSKEVPTYEELLLFLQGHCSVLQSITSARNPPSEARQTRSTVCNTTIRSVSRCPFCADPWHSPFQCGKFQRMKVPERMDAAIRNKLCRNCLMPGHFYRNCERGSCHHCQQKHHSMLHSRSSVPQPQFSAQYRQQSQTRSAQQIPFQSQPQPMNQQQQHNSRPIQHAHTTTQHAQTHSHNTNTNPDNAQATTSQNYVALPFIPSRNILLSTAMIRVKDRFGNTLLARALLDSCSQHCLMTREFSRRLKFHETPTFLSVQGIGSSQMVSTKLVSAEVGSRSSRISQFKEWMQFFVLPRLTVDLPTAAFDPSILTLPGSACLADPGFYESGPIDVIIGAEFYMDLLSDGRMKPLENGPTLQNTVFGWIVSGRLPNNQNTVSQSEVYVCSVGDIQDQLTRFWELETCHVRSVQSIEESACEEIFKNTTVRDESGRFVVTLPKKEGFLNRIGDSRVIATKRFLSLEKRLSMDSELKRLYSEFIHEYQSLGHMSEVIDSSSQLNEVCYYLPHHAVLKPESTTTKLRVVFDASCKSSTGVSLNDALMVGPVVQDELIDIVLRFRLCKFAIVADIAKMYRMIQVQKSDQKLQKILWRDSTDQPLRTYELLTVTYGTASAPYLATKCLQVLADQGSKTHPLASKILSRCFYVDDMLAGVDSIEEGVQLVKEMSELMDSAEKAYGACIYVRTVSESGETVVQLMTSKSRVAPLENLQKKKKRQSIPRLELSSALLLAHLFEKLVKGTELSSFKSFFWTDSMIVKCWLASSPSRWTNFVANRVSEIQHITRSGVWSHVAGTENPADIISRGMTPAQLQYQSLWFHGPSWLRLEESHWPQPPQVCPEIPSSMLEERGAVTAVTDSLTTNEIFELRASLVDSIRLTAYFLRFRFNSQKCNNSNRKVGYLSASELEEALQCLVRLSQKESFPKEYADLSNNRQISVSSKLLSLNPRMMNGIICVGGRLENAAISETRKHPFILDYKHPLTRSVMSYYHQKLFHAGQQLLIATVRQKFWPIHAGSLARSVIHNCVRCFRARPKIQEQLMADLPPERVTQNPVFQRVGVDYCGPFLVTYPQRRCRPVKFLQAANITSLTILSRTFEQAASDVTPR